MKGDLGNLIWIVIIVLGIAGKLLDKKGPRQPPVARPGRGMPPPMRQPGPPQSSGRPGQPGGRAGEAPGRSGQGAPVRPGRAADGQYGSQSSRMGATRAGRPIDEPDDDEGVSLENVKPTIHNWQEPKAKPEAVAQPVVQQIPVQQAVVWSEILGKPAALRGPRR